MLGFVPLPNLRPFSANNATVIVRDDKRMELDYDNYDAAGKASHPYRGKGRPVPVERLRWAGWKR